MGTPFLGEIKIVSFNFPPRGWAFCNGLLLAINQNQALFSLLGTTYGGNGQTTFALPNLQGKTPIHVGSGHTLGETGGEQNHTLTISEIPTHAHTLNASGVPATATIPNSVHHIATSPGFEAYRPASSLAAMGNGTVSSVGGSQAHLNMQPYLTLNFCIALQGVFPSQN
ncbi:MAG TPA: tail fiber protein [Pyrinomonadaceae bacterium]|nr:tail fiber protein [Pyrinomonadaceae bacterium]